jgi:membrane protease YdiL (CAAX protease family)
MVQMKATMGQVLASGWRAIGLGESPLLADLDQTDRSWWRLPLAIVCGGIAAVIALVVVLVIGMIGLIVGEGGHNAQAALAVMQNYIKGGATPGYGASLIILATLALTNGFAALVFTAVASLITRRSFWRSFTTAPRWRWGQLALGLGLNLCLLAPLMAVDVLRGGTQAKFPLFTLSHSPLQIAIYVVVSLVTLVAAAGAEELIFRGWFLRHSAALFRFTWLFLLLNGLAFSSAHGDFDPNAFIDRAFAGFGLCYIALRCGGIEFSTGAHAANNLLIVLFIEPLTLVTPPPMPFDPVTLVESIVGLGIAILGVELALRLPALRGLMQPLGSSVADRTVEVF